MPQTSQFRLLRQKRFAPYFLTQFLGAFNDNIYKNALIVLIAFMGAGGGADTALMVNLAAGLFILPFFLFSAMAGQIADKYPKALLIRRIKLVEVLIMLTAVLAFISANIIFSLLVLFLMGTQSAFFGPVKYAMLPQYLHPDELIGGNALVESGTFLAILIGTIAGTSLAAVPDYGVWAVSLTVLILSAAGYLAARGIPEREATDPQLVLRKNPFAETRNVLRLAARSRTVFLSILGVSWFWFLGATYLAQFPVYTREVLGGDVQLFTLLLALFSVGIATGSLLCERLSGRHIEIGLVPFGAIGLTVFGVDLYFASPQTPWGNGLSLAECLSAPGAWRIVLDVAALGVFGGFYIVPLYALIQQRTQARTRSRIIAANNILNALFMVLSALSAIVLLGAGVSIAGLFLTIAIVNALVALYVFALVPEFLLRFVGWILIHTFYRMEVSGGENIPERGAAVIVCNHVSYVDPVIINAIANRPVRFAMDHRIHAIPGLNALFRAARTIPIASKKDDPKVLENALLQMMEVLRDGELLCIFPEGQLTRDGELNPFRPGVKRVVSEVPVPVVPVALCHLWGSLFSHSHRLRAPRKLFAKIQVRIGEPLDPETLDPAVLQALIARMRGDAR
ncbi:MFS transporter [Granulosicoccaceae sp. 1_MG-2023]|nr:MFS transporter [Granulosicoccaceae sp. 1_MG-2023]